MTDPEKACKLALVHRHIQSLCQWIHFIYSRLRSMHRCREVCEYHHSSREKAVRLLHVP